MERSSVFINYYGRHFFQINAVPSQSDYNAMGRAVIKRHPELMVDSAVRPHVSILEFATKLVMKRDLREGLLLQRGSYKTKPTKIGSCS